jgi:L-ascorbate metabolism protein UlaG (beta-lactamase superfamily)
MIEGSPKVLCGPGEYEIAGVFINGLRSFRDSDKGKTRGVNTMYLMEIEGIKLCHLGDLGHTLSATQIEDVSDADILLIPVGGEPTIDATAAEEVTNLISPKIVIPMHYNTESAQTKLDPLDKFLKEMGIKECIPQPKLTVNKSILPIETSVSVLELRN